MRLIRIPHPPTDPPFLNAFREDTFAFPLTRFGIITKINPFQLALLPEETTD